MKKSSTLWISTIIKVRPITHTTIFLIRLYWAKLPRTDKLIIYLPWKERQHILYLRYISDCIISTGTHYTGTTPPYIYAYYHTLIILSPTSHEQPMQPNLEWTIWDRRYYQIQVSAERLILPGSSNRVWHTMLRPPTSIHSIMKNIHRHIRKHFIGKLLMEISTTSYIIPPYRLTGLGIPRTVLLLCAVSCTV